MDKYHRRSTPRPTPARETHDSIQSQTEIFLRHGGHIETFPLGETGFLQMASPNQIRRTPSKSR